MVSAGRGAPTKCQASMALAALITTALAVTLLTQSRPSEGLTAESLTGFLNSLRIAYPTDSFYPKKKQTRRCSVVPEVPSWDEFYDYVEEQRPCEKMEVVGGSSSSKYGAKQVCTDPGFAPQANNCTVLSFGINNEFSFDDVIADKIGCNVYAFDPTMNQPDHLRGERVHFFALGLGGEEGLGNARVRWFDAPSSVKVDSYMGILKRLNLLNTTIDYLKMDIEGAELRFFRTVVDNHPELLKNVRQIGMEVHFDRLNTAIRDEFWWYLHQLRCLNYRPVYSETTKGWRDNLYHIGKRLVSAAYEIVWVNDAFIKKL